MTSSTLVQSSLPLPLLKRGKVREVYAVDDETVLLVASDRISAFDVVLRDPIPRKGEVLTQISAFWFRTLASITPSHFVTADASEIVERVPVLAEHRDTISGRAMLARRTTPVAFECVVRGYITGSAWKEYSKSGTLAGEPLAKGLRESDRLDPPIFSPATKADTGHDENVTFQHVVDALGAALAARLRDTSFELYLAGREHAAGHGIIIADTKFEFGHSSDGELLLIDEVLTPDSSRFWPADDYQPGRSQQSFDKQPMRDYLEGLRKAGRWDGSSQPEALSPEIVEETSLRYQDAFFRVTGERLPTGS
jgi:phosphoribosylaminoimidazole-succinocarboxamide synthase